MPFAAAAPTAAAVQYSVSGSFTYSLNNVSITSPLQPVAITVHPSPIIQLHYFTPVQVPGDDPFTAVVEPSPPFPLSLVLSNVGPGPLLSLGLQSTPPVVLDNQKGLLIDISLVGVQLDSGEVQTNVALTTQAGSVSAATALEYRDLFTSSLQGTFISYNITYTESLASGNQALAIVSSLDRHNLFQIVSAPASAHAGLSTAFLTNDLPQLNASAYDLPIPDTVWQVNSTSGSIFSRGVAAVADSAACAWSTDATTALANLSVAVPPTAALDAVNAPFLYVRCSPPTFVNMTTGQALPVDSYGVPIGWSLSSAVAFDDSSSSVFHSLTCRTWPLPAATCGSPTAACTQSTVHRSIRRTSMCWTRSPA